MPKSGRARCVLAGVVLAFAGDMAGASVFETTAAPIGAGSISVDARHLIEWIVRSHDNRGLPFAVVDKKSGRLALFSARGREIAASPVLIGAAPGDDAVAGLGKIAPSRIPWSARTTPAGRFASVPGRNLDNEDVVWFDYGAGLAIHRLRGGRLEAERLRRIASNMPAASHASAGCVVVPVAFYEAVVRPLLGATRGIVYVTPEFAPLQRFFPRLDVDLLDD
jgi:hypothetical protein